MKNSVLILLFCLITGGTAWLLQSFGVNDSLHSAITTPVQQVNLVVDLALAFALLLLPLWLARTLCFVQMLLTMFISANLHFLTVPLSVAGMMAGWTDFYEMGAGAMLDYIYWQGLLLSVSIFAGQWLLLRFIRITLPCTVRIAYGLCLVLTLGSLLYSRLESRQRQAQRLNGNEIVLYFGYVPGWIVEIASGRTSELEAALSMPVCPRVPDSLPHIPFTNKLVFMQVESLDFGLITQPKPYPMPFLQKMLEKSAVFHVNGQKKLGSANSDYEWLTGCVASSDALMYGALPAIPTTLNQLLQEQGYSSRFFHGLTGHFMRLRPTYEKLGFGSLVFKEELLEAGYPEQPKRFMQQVSDGDLLAYASLFVQEKAPFMHFLVTISMHSERDFPVPNDLKKVAHSGYLASTRHFDTALAKYVAAMPDDVTLILIGDHTSYFEPRSPETPAIIYRKNADLSRYTKKKLPQLSRCQWGIWLRRNMGLALPERYALDNIDQNAPWVEQSKGQ
ncbi:MAG: sulfatase-like hydrolase/transferase [Desulfovibrionaceae bacterium]|nr:sulfatase-like hydrolase/transferase [Desulfovibrionaceae bacterium]